MIYDIQLLNDGNKGSSRVLVGSLIFKINIISKWSLPSSKVILHVYNIFSELIAFLYLFLCQSCSQTTSCFNIKSSLYISHSKLSANKFFMSVLCKLFKWAHSLVKLYVRKIFHVLHLMRLWIWRNRAKWGRKVNGECDKDRRRKILIRKKF